MGENGEDTGYLFPQIPENAIREPFNFVEWEGFAVTQEELKTIQELLCNPQLSAQFSQLYAKGKSIRNIDGQVELAALESSAQLGIRYDGPIVVLNALNRQQYPPDPKAIDDGFRKKAEGKGVFFTALSDFEVGSDERIISTTGISKQELDKRVTRTTGFYADSALLESANSLLLPQAKSNELELSLLSHTLRHGEDLGPYAESFKVEGAKLSEYMSRVRKERGSILKE